MDTKQTIIAILQDITGADVSDDLNQNIFDSGLVDSMATVEMLLELQDQCGIDVPISEFDRNQWNTPNKIIEKVASMQ